MNKLKAILNDCSIINRFNVHIDLVNVKIYSENNQVFLLMESNKSKKELRDLFLEIYSLIFIYFGFFPKLVELEFNYESFLDEITIGLYNTMEVYRNCVTQVIDITDFTINQQVIDQYRNMIQEPIRTMQWLISGAYEHVLIDHKMTLLTHALEGIVNNKINTQNEKEMLFKKFYNELKKYNKISANWKGNERVGKYLLYVFNVLDSNFFYYNEKFSCEILELLGIEDYEFLFSIQDLRNGNSHYLSNKKLHMKECKLLAFTFEILFYSLRLFIIDRLQIKNYCIEKNIEEYYKEIHDWILEEFYHKYDGYKSSLYSKISKRTK